MVPEYYYTQHMSSWQYSIFLEEHSMLLVFNHPDHHHYTLPEYHRRYYICLCHLHHHSHSHHTDNSLPHYKHHHCYRRRYHTFDHQRDIFSERHNRTVLLHRWLGYIYSLLNSMLILEDNTLRVEVRSTLLQNREHH